MLHVLAPAGCVATVDRCFRESVKPDRFSVCGLRGCGTMVSGWVNRPKTGSRYLALK